MDNQVYRKAEGRVEPAISGYSQVAVSSSKLLFFQTEGYKTYSLHATAQCEARRANDCHQQGESNIPHGWLSTNFFLFLQNCTTPKHKASS
ncbi:hypothetical protein EVAR_41397_1 [Eumeta japonica]|uniref:Uncharacterized protein n=1 Tax=Eumeta variegata TaxID=151549 RepID=A0A4C1WZE2_EUMVA|nr:hypothetical protein EVAR_41397_1 [Eumeta japonica]